MKASNDLHALIHSMSKNEKGFFVKFASQHGKQRNHIRLFQAINAQERYDRAALCKKFAGEKFLKQIHVAQHYLYHLILKSLRHYHEKNYVELELYSLLADTFILEIRGMKEGAGKLLKKAKKIAATHYQYPILLEILKQYVTSVVGSKSPNVLGETQDIYREIFEITQMLEEEYTFRSLNHSILLCYRKDRQLASKQYSEVLRDISNHPLLTSETEPASFYAKYLKFNIRCIEARIYGDREIAHENYKEILQIWEQHPQMIKAAPHLFKIHISNFLGNAILLGNFDQVEFYMNKIDQVPARNLREKVESFQNLTYLKLLYYLNLNYLEDGRQFIAKMEPDLDQYDRHLNPARALVIYYNILMVFFLLEDFDGTISWLNKILHQGKAGPRQDIKIFAHILEFIIHYELGHDLMLESLLKNAFRSVAKQIKTTQYEQTILTNFKRLLRSNSSEEKHLIYIEFREALKHFAALNQKLTGIDEIIIWLSARINRESLRNIFASQLKT